MSPELVAILGVGVALAVFMTHMVHRTEERLRQAIRGSGERIRRDLNRSEERTRQDMQGSGEPTGSRRSAQDTRFTSHDRRSQVLEARVSDTGERLARVEGLLAGRRRTGFGRQVG